MGLLVGKWRQLVGEGRGVVCGKPTPCKDRWPKRGVNWAFFLFSKL
jgi:hypothetical protein